MLYLAQKLLEIYFVKGMAFVQIYALDLVETFLDFVISHVATVAVQLYLQLLLQLFPLYRHLLHQLFLHLHLLLLHA